MSNLNEKNRAIKSCKIIIAECERLFNEHSKQGKPFLDRKYLLNEIDEQKEHIARIQKLSNDTPEHEVWDIHPHDWEHVQENPYWFEVIPRTT